MQLKWPMLWDLFSLFPAYAGVIPDEPEKERLNIAFPRIRGGDPKFPMENSILDYFSPHTRG